MPDKSGAKLNNAMDKNNSSGLMSVLIHLKSGGTLTQTEALLQFGVGNLPDVVLTLRKRGYVIDTEMVDFVTRYKKKSKYGRYRLVSAPQVQHA